jgi:diguanylate cyclase (GGDEF)-like protein
MFRGERADVQVDICGAELQSSHLGKCFVASLRIVAEGSERSEGPRGTSQNVDELHTAHSVIDALEDGLIACDSHGTVLLANPSALALQGLPPNSELLGRPFPQNISLLSSDGTRINSAEHPLTRALGGATVRSEQIQLPREKGGPRWITASAQPLEIGGAGLGALLLLHDSSPQREHEAWLTRLALYDPLTGVANRSLLLDHLTRALVRSRREGGRASLLFCDLDGLKLVNDTYGHDIGDEVLTAVARRLEGVLRPSDTVARLGGDEFAAVAYSSSPDPAELDAVMRRVRTVLSDPYQVRNQTISVLVTLGSVIADGRTDDATSVLVRADRELYQMKTMRMKNYED